MAPLDHEVPALESGKRGGGRTKPDGMHADEHPCDRDTGVIRHLFPSIFLLVMPLKNIAAPKFSMYHQGLVVQSLAAVSGDFPSKSSVDHLLTRQVLPLTYQRTEA